MSSFVLPGLANRGCAVCGSGSGLQHCVGCKVVRYCGVAHQKKHRPEHKDACNAIKASREKLATEEAALRSRPRNWLPNLFEDGVGHFYGILETRDYMRARCAAAHDLLCVDTVQAVEAALDHFMDMLRLCRSDNLGVRDIVPGLMLRLGREQECYDFLAWWALVPCDYNWGDTDLPYMDVRNADPFAPIAMFHTGNLSLTQLVCLTLLKIRLRLDMERYDPEYLDPGAPWPSSPDTTLHGPVGKLVRKKIQTIDKYDVSGIVDTLQGQWLELARMVHEQNPYFWDALFETTDQKPTLPASWYTHGSVEEAQMALYYSQAAWEESEDAMVLIEPEIVQLTATAAAASAAPAGRTGAPEKRKGSGQAFPTRFMPPSPVSHPAELFPGSHIGAGKKRRFVCRTDRARMLVYVDGACRDNGGQIPRAGWAVVNRPEGHDDDDSCAHILSGQLERKGPFGDESVATSNRAELRAAIAALRHGDWRAEGFDGIVIATDSSYLVDGATSWAKGWVKKGWTKAQARGQVKNRDLWELFLGEVERWEELGLAIELWKIPREFNTIADAAAKAAAASEQTGPLDFEGGDVIGSVTQRDHRVLCLCLDYPQMFDELYGSLISRITSRVPMDRVTTQEAALAILDRQRPPSVILVADGAITNRTSLWRRIVEHLHDGATVVLAASFSSFATGGGFARCFALAGLSWTRGGYHRTTVAVRPGAVGPQRLSLLPRAYSAKSLYVEGPASEDVWYATEKGEAAVVFAQVGRGRLGYIGDVNGEQGSEAAVLAMCGLLT
ncbi:hypothetical protein GGR56DRAFT_668408 [Xylariaceae sp. FL0804]|nr:hypothetical protein GGR56DRAFT_668408 [Xylariaceae sp. FL0804]